jgi:hypothetical protein
MAILREHFDSVQIFASRWNPDGKESDTFSYSMGQGNYNARYGQVRGWILKQEEQYRVEARKGEVE